MYSYMDIVCDNARINNGHAVPWARYARTLPNYETEPDEHLSWPPGQPKIDSSSHNPYKSAAYNPRPKP